MENKKYLDDIGEIRDIMSRSSRFSSLSGISGMLAGIYALLGFLIAWYMLAPGFGSLTSAFESFSQAPNPDLSIKLISLAGVIALLAIATAVVLSARKARKNQHPLWGASSRRLLTDLFTPVVTGGIFCLVLIQKQTIGLIVPGMLIFYGIGLIAAGRHSFSDLKNLGYINLALGLIATQFVGYGLYFWAAGFGISHIVYGFIMYNKYERKSEE